MSKFLLLAVVFMIAYWVVKAHRRRIERSEQRPRAGEDMVRCAVCGIHLPRSEGFTAGGHFYCSNDHRQQHLQAQ